jgi:hypothetical protein
VATTALYRQASFESRTSSVIAPAAPRRSVAQKRARLEARPPSCTRLRGDAAHKRLTRGCRGLARTSQQVWSAAPQVVAATLVLGRAATAAAFTSLPIQTSSSAMPWWIAPLAVLAGIAGIGIQLLLAYCWVVAKGSMH